MAAQTDATPMRRIKQATKKNEDRKKMVRRLKKKSIILGPRLLPRPGRLVLRLGLVEPVRVALRAARVRRGPRARRLLPRRRGDHAARAEQRANGEHPRRDHHRDGCPNYECSRCSSYKKLEGRGFTASE